MRAASSAHAAGSRIADLAIMCGLGVVLLFWLRWMQPIELDMLSGVDNRAYWSAWQGGLYEPNARLGEPTYLYSPAFAQAIYPLTFLPWEAFRVLWIAGSWIAMLWLLWPLHGLARLAAIAMACYFCVMATADWIVALSIGLGLRHPAAWTAIVLTKVTPGVGLLWFVLRREWRGLAIALGATAAVITLSTLAGPHLWGDWIGVLLRSTEFSGHGSFFGLAVPSLFFRLPAAAGIVVLGAWTGQRWTLPVAAVIAQPDIWATTLLIMAAVPRLYATNELPRTRV